LPKARVIDTCTTPCSLILTLLALPRAQPLPMLHRGTECEEDTTRTPGVKRLMDEFAFDTSVGLRPEATRVGPYRYS
jgi:hypothetical protein